MHGSGVYLITDATVPPHAYTLHCNTAIEAVQQLFLMANPSVFTLHCISNLDHLCVIKLVMRHSTQLLRAVLRCKGSALLLH